MPASDDNITYESKSTVTGGALTDLKPEQRAEALRGAQLLAKALRAEGVDVLGQGRAGDPSGAGKTSTP